MKRIILIAALASLAACGFSQGHAGQTPRPPGFPTGTTSQYFLAGYAKTDSGVIFPSRDTNWLPRFCYTMVVWPRPGVDTTIWTWDCYKWVQAPKLTGGGTVTDVYATYGQYLDSFWVVHNNGPGELWYVNPAAQGILAGGIVTKTGQPNEYNVSPTVYRIGDEVINVGDEEQFVLPAECGGDSQRVVAWVATLTPGNRLQQLVGPCDTIATFPAFDSDTAVVISWVVQSQSDDPDPAPPQRFWGLNGNFDVDGTSYMGTNIDEDVRFKRYFQMAGILNPSITSFGVGALSSNTSGGQNVAMGVSALQGNTTGTYNTGVGFGALVSNTTGVNNTAIGRGAMLLSTTASYCVSIGSDISNAGNASYVTSVGYSSGGGVNIGIGTESSTYGAISGSRQRGTSNTYIGARSGLFSTINAGIGIGNSALGHSALTARMDGNYMVAVGLGALSGATNPDSAQQRNATCTGCVAVGALALSNTGQGFRHIGIGYNVQVIDTGSLTPQVNIGDWLYKGPGAYGSIGGSGAVVSSAFSVISPGNNTGFMVPSMTAAQRLAIASPANGLIVYDTDTACLMVRRNAAWQSMCRANDGGSLGAYIPLTGTTVGNQVTGDIQIDELAKGIWTPGPNYLTEGDYSGIAFGEGGAGPYYNNPTTSQNAAMLVTSLGVGISGTYSGFRGITGTANYSANYTSLSYTQKVYVDSVVTASVAIHPLYITKGFLTQTGTGAPTFSGPAALNTIAGTWARSSAGTYTYTKTGYFVIDKTFPSEAIYTDYVGNLYRVTRTSADVITVRTYTSPGVLADDVLSAWEFELLIYN